MPVKIFLPVSLIFLFQVICFAQQPKLMVPTGHVGGISSACFSPDGKYVLTSSGDKEAKLWNTISGRRLLDLQGHQTQVNYASFSPDGNYIATASEDNTVKVWDAKTGKKISDINAASNYIYQAVFSPDNKYLLTCASRDFTARVWDAVSGKLFIKLSGHHGQIYQAAFSPDGKYIVTASEDKTAITWDAKTGKMIHYMPDPESYISSAAFSPACTDDPVGGQYIIATGRNYVNIFDGKTGRQINKIGTSDAVLTSASFSPNGKFILAGYENGSAKLTALIDKESFLTLKGHNKRITNAAFSADGKMIVTASEDSTAKLWDATNGKLLATLKGQQDFLISASFSPNGKYILTASNDGTVRIWNTANGSLQSSLEGHTQEAEIVSFSPDGKYMVTTAARGNPKIWNTMTGQVIASLAGHTDRINFVSFSPDSKQVVTSSYDSTARVWNITNGNQLAILRGHNGFIGSVCYSADGKYLLTSSFDSTARIWDASSLKYLSELNSHKAEMETASFSPDGNYIVTAGVDTARLWNRITGRQIRTLEGNKNFLSALSFSPDGKFIIGSKDIHEPINLWDGITGNAINGLPVLQDINDHAVFSPDGKLLVTMFDVEGIAKVWNLSNWKLINTLKLGKIKFSGIDFKHGHITGIYNSEIRTYDLQTGKKLYTTIPLDSNDHIILTPTGYYQSTPNASKLLHYVTPDLNVISFEQLDVKYNRPDLVLEAMGNTDTGLIKTYRNAYYKRIKKLGIDTTAFGDGYSVPEADFVGRDLVPFEQRNDKLVLHIKGSDRLYKLSRFNVWVNEVPLYGQRGISISGNNSLNFDSTVSIQLSQGENRIETTVSNVNGAESYRMPLIVNYTTEKEQRIKTYFIGIGIDRFVDSEYNLNYSTKDIHDLGLKLKTVYGNDISIDTLFNEQVTIDHVKALKEKLLQTTVNDRVIISYSGHGLLSKNYDYYLSTYAVNFKKPEENGLPYDVLESLLDSIPARKKLMLIDACHSGEVDKDEYRETALDNATLDSNHIVSRGVFVKSTSDGTEKLGLQNSFELMQNIFVNVGKSTGASIISAAAGTEMALENGNLKNGVFTYCLLEALNKYPSMKISELKKIVAARVEALTNGMQRPTSRNEAIAVDWEVWGEGDNRY